MKKCVCGCTQFQASQKQLWSIIVSWDKDGVINTDHDDNYMEDSSYPNGPFVCRECGAEYATEYDIPDDEEED